MTQQRLEQLRGNLANLRDSTADYRASVLAQFAIVVCHFYPNWHEMDALADALGISPDGEENDEN